MSRPSVRARVHIAARERLDPTTIDALTDAVRAVATAFRHGRSLLICGNGGSAADAQHLAAEFVGRFERERRGYPAIALTTDSSALTAIGNDFGFDHVFRRQVAALGRPGDVLMAITTSGRSPNVLGALTTALSLGLRTIALTGPMGLPGGHDAHVVIRAPGTTTAGVQEAHLMIEHVIAEVVEDTLACAGEPVVDDPSGGVISLTDAVALRQAWRDAGLNVAWTNGCFDLLHVGHMASLHAARSCADRLIVGINDDASVARLKGPGRPVVPASDRAELVAATKPVDAVVIFEEDTPARCIAELRPDVHCKGEEYALRDPSALPELAAVEAGGGRTVFLPMLEGRSSTRLINKARSVSCSERADQ